MFQSATTLVPASQNPKTALNDIFRLNNVPRLLVSDHFSPDVPGHYIEIHYFSLFATDASLFLLGDSINESILVCFGCRVDTAVFLGTVGYRRRDIYVKKGLD